MQAGQLPHPRRHGSSSAGARRQRSRSTTPGLGPPLLRSSCVRRPRPHRLARAQARPLRQVLDGSHDDPLSSDDAWLQRARAASATRAQAAHGSFPWLEHWYPVGFISDFDKSAPQRCVLLGIPLVIWHQPAAAAAGSGSGEPDPAAGWRVFADACPHRLVPLSEGRITPDGLLECPYHGWAFNAAGGCEVIPQEGNRHNPRACATAFPCVVKQGLLFVKPQPLPKAPAVQDGQHAAAAALAGRRSGSSSSSSRSAAASATAVDVPIVPQFEQEGWLVQDTWRDVPYDFSSLLENVLDASHVPFTHHGSISNRKTVGRYDMRLTQQVQASGFVGHWATGPRGGALGPQDTRFVAPCLMTHIIDASDTRGFESMVVVYAVPIAPGQCRLLNRNAFRFTRGGVAATLARLAMRLVPGWAVHMGTQVPLEDDQIFLHLGELQYVAARRQGKSAAQAYFLSSPADTYITAFRRWLAGCAGGGPFGDVSSPNYLEQLPPRMSREQLLDRFSQHTQNCAQCLAALQRVRGLRRALQLGARAFAALAVLTGAVAVAGSSPGAGAAASPDGGGGGWLQRGAELVLALLAAAAGGAAAGAAAARLLVWLLLAGACAAADGWLAGVEARFMHGDWPPPRNLDKA